MGGQTVYQDQALGFPGQRVGMNSHKAKSMVNDTGAVRQVHDLTVDTGTNATTYQFEIDGVPITVTSPASGTTVTTVRDQLLAQARSIQDFEDLVSFNPTGADSIRVTAIQQGNGFTLTETDALLSEAVVTANVATVSIPFGRAIVRRTAGANVTDKSAALPSAAAQEFMGVLERIHSIVDPTNASPADQQGAASPFQDLTVVHEGQMIVEVDEAIAPGDPVFFRHTTGGTGPGAVGTFRTDADTARADQITGAKFERTTGGVGLSIVSLNSA